MSDRGPKNRAFVDAGSILSFVRKPLVLPVATVLLVAFVGAFLLRGLAPLVMVSIPTEETLLSEVMGAAGEDNEYKAKKVLEKLAPTLSSSGSMCFTTDDEQVFSQAAEVFRLRLPDLETTESRLATPPELKTGPGSLRVSLNIEHKSYDDLHVSLHRGDWSYTLQKNLETSLSSKTFEVEDWSAASTEEPWILRIEDTGQQDEGVLVDWSLTIPKEPRGPRNSDCVEYLNGSNGTDYPVTAQNILLKLHELEIKGADFRGDAIAYERDDDDDLAGWQHFEGGELLRAFGRARLLGYANLPTGNLGPASLFRAANQLLQNQEKESEAAKSFSETVRESVFSLFGNLLAMLIQFGVFFASILIATRVIRSTSGFRRLLAALLSLCLVVAFIGQQSPDVTTALSSLSLETSKSLYAEADGISSLVGLPFIIVSQILDFIVETVQVIYQPSTIWLFIQIGLTWAIFRSTRVSGTITAAYLLLLIGGWQNGDYAIFPFDLDGLDASLLLPPAVWAIQLTAVFGAAVLARNLSTAYGERLVDSVSALLLGTHQPAVEPAESSPKASDPAPENAEDVQITEETSQHTAEDDSSHSTGETGDGDMDEESRA